MNRIATKRKFTASASSEKTCLEGCQPKSRSLQSLPSQPGGSFLPGSQKSNPSPRTTLTPPSSSPPPDQWLRLVRLGSRPAPQQTTDFLLIRQAEFVFPRRVQPLPLA